MRIGVPKEIKTQEFRVGMTPSGVAILTAKGHTVLVEQGAGLGSSITDEAYLKAGAKIVTSREEIWGCDMVVKVKEPIAPEFALMRKDQLLLWDGKPIPIKTSTGTRKLPYLEKI